MTEPLPGDFFRLVERSSDLIVIVREGRFAYVNPAFAQELGYTQQELVDQPAAQFAHPDERESVRNNIASTIAGTSRAGSRRRLLRRDGSTLTIESSTFAAEFGGGPAAVLIGRNLKSELRLQ